jgi:alcohol dehydrogenase
MYLPNQYRFSCSAKINSGTRALENLPMELDALNATRPLIIAGENSPRRGYVKKVISALKDSGMTLGVCDDIPDDPDPSLIGELVNLYRHRDHDSIVAVGAGPVVDVAKIVNIAVSHNGGTSLRQLEGGARIMNPLGPFILVPTAGVTGYETSRYAGVRDMMFSSPFLMPDLVVIDPRMVPAVESGQMIDTAMTALTHAVEAYTYAAKNPIADVYGYAAIGFIMEHLAPVVSHPADREGRCALVNAACMAGCIISDDTRGMTHALGETVSTMFGIGRGISMGIMLPYTVAYRAVSGEAPIAELLLPVAGFEEYGRTAPSLRAAVAVTMMIDLVHELHEKVDGVMPRTLEEAGVPEYMLQDIAETALSHGLSRFGRDDYLTVARQAWEGSPAMDR